MAVPTSLKSPSPFNPSHRASLLPQGTGNEELDKLIELAGYAYDPLQDIFYSVLNPWQRGFGYCRLYDEAAAFMGMIIDCEPIYFEYQGRKWMIAVWKGQYDLVTGGEIGVYYDLFEFKIPGLISGTFYRCADDDNMLNMSFTLKKNGKVLFTRTGRHWWLTGFKLGEFSQPWELTMDVTIEFPDWMMRDAFISGLMNAGYTEDRILVLGNTVYFVFDKPRTPQPLTRTALTDAIIQKKNEYLCALYRQLTESYKTVDEKLLALFEKSPEMYDRLFLVGRNNMTYKLIVLGIMLTVLYFASSASSDAVNSQAPFDRQSHNAPGPLPN